MAVTNFTPLLGLALPTTGDLSGTWGTTVNDAITGLLDSAVAGTTTLSSDVDVTLSTTNGAANQARNAIIRWTATGTVTRNITAPAQSKAYVVINATGGTQSIVIRGSGPTTGVTIPAGARALVAWNGSDFVKIVSNPVVLTTDVSGTLPVANGGTGVTTSTGTGAVVLSNSPTLVTPALGTPTSGTLTNATGLPLTTGVTGLLPVANGGTGTATPNLVAGSNVTITGTWPNQTIAAASPGTGTVTAVSVATANGFAGTSSGGATPALTLTTSVTGVVKGNGTALSAATAGTDYVAPGTATNFTALQTFSGTASNLAAKLLNAKEAVTVSATAATGTINYDVTTQSVLYYTSNASGNWTLNVRASSGTSLDSALTTGESVTVAFLVTQGSTAYYQSGFQVDGNAVTPKWQGASAPTSGNANGVDIYLVTVIKTGAATFSAFASQNQFA